MHNIQAITELTESEFIELVKAIFSEAKNPDDTRFKELFSCFTSIVEHPDGSDLIFYTFGDDCTPDAITAAIKDWYTENNKPCFKDR